MLANETIKAYGQLSIKITDAEGNVKTDMTIPNLVVTTGKNWIAARMKETGRPGEMTHMAIGAGTAVPVIADSTLGTELGRVALTTAGGTVADNVVTYQATFAPGTGTGAVTEAGIFNANSAGTMLCRTKFDVVNKGAADTMAIEWRCTLV